LAFLRVTSRIALSGPPPFPIQLDADATRPLAVPVYLQPMLDQRCDDFVADHQRRRLSISDGTEIEQQTVACDRPLGILLMVKRIAAYFMSGLAQRFQCCRR